MSAVSDLLEALANYPAPAQVVVRTRAGPPRVAYAPPVQHAMALYAAHFQRHPHEATILDAFAAVGRAVCERSRALVGAQLNHIADTGRPRPGASAEARNLARDLGTVAAALASEGGRGPRRREYLDVCEALGALFSAGWPERAAGRPR